MWRFAKRTSPHLREGSDNAFSISYHLSPDFFHYQDGHWLWRTVKMPGFWNVLRGAERSRHRCELHHWLLPRGSGCDCCLPLGDALESPNENRVKPSELAWRCQIAPRVRGRTQATREKRVKATLAFSSAGSMLYSRESEASPPTVACKPRQPSCSGPHHSNKHLSPTTETTTRKAVFGW